MRELIFYFKPGCPWCKEFEEKIWTKLQEHSFGREQIILSLQDVTDPVIKASLAKTLEKGDTLRDRIRLRTVPHLLLLTPMGDFIWTGGSDNRTFDNVVDFITGSIDHAVKI